VGCATYSHEYASLGASTGVHFSPGQVTILLAKDDVETWGDPSQAGIYTSVGIGSENSLELVIEKDFACLERSDEDNMDTFENRHAAAIC